MLKKTLSQITTHNTHDTNRNLFVPRKWLAACAVVTLFASSQPSLVAANSKLRGPTITRISLTELLPGDPEARFLVAVEGANLCDGDTPVADDLHLQVEGYEVRTVDHTVCTPDHGLNQRTGGNKRGLKGPLEGEGSLTLKTNEGFAMTRSLHIKTWCSDKDDCVYEVILKD